MAQYARIAPEFWTGHTGRKLRRLGRDTQVVALYLVSCPTASPLGLYYLPLPTLCHEVGISKEGASKALRSLSEAHFASYDGASEAVFVPEMARYQVASVITPKDKRHKWIVNELQNLRKFPQFALWFAHYKEAFSLPETKPLTSPLEAPSMPTATATATATTTGEDLRPKKTGRGRPTWLTPFAEIWKERYGGQLSFGEAGAALEIPVAELGAEEVAARFRRYCQQTEGKVASVSRFAKIIGEYANGKVHETSPPGPLRGSAASLAANDELMRRIHAGEKVLP